MCAGFLRCVIKADIGLRAEFSFCSNSKLLKVAGSHVSLVSFSKSLLTLTGFCYQWYAQKQKRVNRCSFFFFHLSGWSRSAWLISLLRLKVKLERIYFWHSVKKAPILFKDFEKRPFFDLRRRYFLVFREIGNYGWKGGFLVNLILWKRFSRHQIWRASLLSCNCSKSFGLKLSKIFTIRLTGCRILKLEAVKSKSQKLLFKVRAQNLKKINLFGHPNWTSTNKQNAALISITFQSQVPLFSLPYTDTADQYISRYQC